MRTVTYNENEWRLVPVEPTEDMLEQACTYDTTKRTAKDDEWNRVTWSLMLEAAPQPDEVVGEAVAWRWRSDAQVQYNKPWNLTHDGELVRLMIDAGGHIIEKLFIHPQPDAARDADAARYRFLRDIGWFEAKYGEFEYSNDVMSERLSKDLDACIDAAMAAGRGEVG